MYLIIVHHYVVNSGLMDIGGPIYQNPFSTKSLCLILAGAWGKVGINCFVLITGYFMCQKTITFQKFIRLVSSVVFYKCIIYILFVIFGYETFSVTMMLETLVPELSSFSHDFVGCFIVFYLLIPYLNILVENMNDRSHLRIIMLLVFLYSIIGTVPKFTISFNYVSWFIILYLIASYIKLYPKKIYDRTELWFVLTSISVIVAIFSIVFSHYMFVKYGKLSSYYFVADSNKIMALICSVCSFMMFRNIKISNSKFINIVGGSTFGVLLIHANSATMRRWLWYDVFDNVGHYDTDHLFIHVLGCAGIVFVICSAIEIMRIAFCEKKILTLCNKHEGKVS